MEGLQKNLYVFAYDISQDKLRSKLYRFLKSHSVRQQFSVFECYLSKQERNDSLLHLIDTFESNPKEDKSLILYKIDAHNDSIYLGTAQQTDAVDGILMLN